MLVMTRKKNESIVVNNDIVISVVEIRGDKVRLAITCPKEIPVHRQEVFEAIYGRPPGHIEPSPTELLAKDIASLAKQIEQGDDSLDLAKLLAAKRLELASLRTDSELFTS